ncbi:MAG: glycosyltransferase [Clostridiales bacterium]|nr:glycosyltransferase [Clostridiales bacterium]
MPKFSIIVPIYNVEQYLIRCIESLVNQTLKDIEIILVDDGSPDGCPAICDEYAASDSGIRVIHKKNGGVSAARNDGLALTTGEWVLFCDSDDWMERDACEALYDAGEKENVDVVVADIYRIKGHEIIYNQFFASEFTYRDKAHLNRLVMTDLYQTYCPNPPEGSTIAYGGPWNKAVKRSLLVENDIRFDVSLLGLYDDILYTAYVYANMKSITYIRKPVYNYVVVETSITKSYKPNSVDISKRIFRAFEKFLSIYAPDGRWDEAYYALVIRRFEEMLRLYFFSRKNPDKLPVRLRKLKRLMREETYVVAAKKG